MAEAEAEALAELRGVDAKSADDLSDSSATATDVEDELAALKRRRNP
jgi:hypothetical protein